MTGGFLETILVITDAYAQHILLIFGGLLLLYALKKNVQLRSRLALEVEQNELLRTRLEESQESIQECREQRAGLLSDLRYTEQRYEDLKARQQHEQQELLTQFKALSGDVLEKNSSRFLTLAREVFDRAKHDTQSSLEQREEQLQQLVGPLNERLQDMHQALAALDKERTDSFARLETQVRDLVSLQSVLQKETHRLSRALQTPLKRGQWGEMQLRRILEYAGLLEHCHFLTAPYIETDTGARLFPDVVVSLPGNRTIIIDAKAPLQALLDEESGEQQVLRKKHCQQLRAHIKKLGSRQYCEHVEGSPDFVIMFLPAAHLLHEALSVDAELIEFATAKQVIPATPLSLLVLLKTIAFTWQEERARSHALQIKTQGKALLDSVTAIAASLEQLGKHLQKSTGAYNRVVRQCEKKLIPQAESLQQCGLQSSAVLPELECIEDRIQAVEFMEYSVPYAEGLHSKDPESKG